MCAQTSPSALSEHQKGFSIVFVRSKAGYEALKCGRRRKYIVLKKIRKVVPSHLLHLIPLRLCLWLSFKVRGIEASELMARFKRDYISKRLPEKLNLNL